MQDHSGRQKALDKKRAGLNAPVRQTDLGSDVDEDMAIEDREEVGHNGDVEMNGVEGVGVDPEALDEEADVRLGGECNFDIEAEKAAPAQSKERAELAGQRRLHKDAEEEDIDMDFEAIEQQM